MPKAEWGTKRICPTTGKRFYDLNKNPIVSPYTGEIVDIESVRRKMAASVISRAVPDKDDDVLVEDLETEDVLMEVRRRRRYRVGRRSSGRRCRRQRVAGRPGRRAGRRWKKSKAGSRCKRVLFPLQPPDLS